MLAAKLCNTNCDHSDLPTQIIFLFCQQEWCLLQPRKCIMNTNGSLQPFKITVAAVEVSTVFMKPDWWRVSRLYTQKWVDRCLWVGGRRYQVVKRKYRFFGQLKRVNLLYSWNKGRPDLDSWVRSWSEGNFARYSSKQTKKTFIDRFGSNCFGNKLWHFLKRWATGNPACSFWPAMICLIRKLGRFGTAWVYKVTARTNCAQKPGCLYKPPSSKESGKGVFNPQLDLAAVGQFSYSDVAVSFSEQLVRLWNCSNEWTARFSDVFST